MMWNIRNIAIGLMFLLFAVFCLIITIRKGANSVYITGTLVFAIVGLGFLKRGRY